MKEDYSLDAMFSHLLCSRWLPWFCLQRAFYFLSAMPTSVLTFKKESDQAIGATSMTPQPCCLSLHCCMTGIASDRPSLLMSVGCVCWLALQKLQVFLCHHASLSQHALGLGFTAEHALTLTSPPSLYTNTHSFKTKGILLHFRDKSKCAP